jgi:hypothetical protein
VQGSPRHGKYLSPRSCYDLKEVGGLSCRWPSPFDDHDEDQADLIQEQVEMLALIRDANVSATHLCASLALKSRCGVWSQDMLDNFGSPLG